MTNPEQNYHPFLAHPIFFIYFLFIYLLIDLNLTQDIMLLEIKHNFLDYHCYYNYNWKKIKGDLQPIYFWGCFLISVHVFWRITNGKLSPIIWAAYSEVTSKQPHRNDKLLHKRAKRLSDTTVQTFFLVGCIRFACLLITQERYFLKLINTPS